MDDEDAFARIAREHPELTGKDRLRAIRDLKQQQKARSREAKATGRECPSCHETVKPDEPWLLGLFAALLALLEVATLAASLVAAARPFSSATVHGPWVAVLWPVAAVDGWAHPRLLAVIVAFLALAAAGWLLGKANARAVSRAACPRCGELMPAPGAP